MAEIAHPYQDTAAADAAPAAAGAPARLLLRARRGLGGPRVEVTEPEERYQRLRSAFVHDHGEITDSYICESGPMAVAVTAIPPKPLERKLLRLKDRIEMHSETETTRAHAPGGGTGPAPRRGAVRLRPERTPWPQPAAAGELALRLAARLDARLDPRTPTARSRR